MPPGGGLYRQENMPCNYELADKRFRFSFQMVLLSISKVEDVAHRIIILEILRIRSLMTKAIVRNLGCP